MKFFADLHIHSRYSLRTHPDMEIPTLVKWAKIKGLALLGTGDFTLPQWLVELRKILKPGSGRGIYEYDDVKFLLTTEVCCAYTRGGKSFKIHHIVFAPNFSVADRLNDALAKYGDLETEAQPTVSLTAEDLVKAVLDVSSECLVVPAHPWGLQYALFSPTFGYDSIAEAYGSQAENIRVLETGLGCDPVMARRWKQADGCTLISNSDAYHPFNLGREANIFDCPIDYKDITAALMNNDPTRFLGTLESFPQEDRYFMPGHKTCQTHASDENKGSCPTCKKPFNPGVSERVDYRADRSLSEAAKKAGAFQYILPLQDILADVLGFQPDADTVQKQYLAMTSKNGPELEILVNWTEDRLKKELSLPVAESVLAVRRGEIVVEPGYDGVAGRVHAKLPQNLSQNSGQLKLF